MSLSKDLISQFVKATKDTTTVKKESTVYGTVVKYNEKTYVKIDGSDLLTPAETLSSVEEGERVSIMIKDHTATITGNYTAPSASSIKVDGMDADLKANTADIKNLVAKNAEIENLVASKATIEDLRAANAEIDTLKSNYAEIETLVADKASIGDLAAVNADIKSLKADKADIAHLEANYATIGSLNAVYADVTRLEADKANITDLTATNAKIANLEANKADITVLEANYATIEQLDAANANITNLQAETANINTALIDKANVSDLAAANAVIADLKAGKAEIADLEAANAKIADLEADKADISVLESNYATIKQLDATNANVTNLQTETANINKALIDKANVSDLTATNANVTNLQATKADVTDLNAANANINTLTGNLADITTLVNGNLTSDNIQSMVITGDKFTVEDGFIKNAMIESVNASKINTGVINTNNVSIQSNDGSMILQGNLQQFKDENGNVRIQIGKDTSGNFTFVLYDENGTGQLINQNGIQSSDAIADGLIVDAKVADNANIAGSKLDIDSVVTEVNNGSTNIKGTKIYLDDQKQTLNVAFNNMSTTVSGNTNTLESHTTSINTMNGEISQLISDTTITKQDGTTVSLKDAYNSTVDTVNSHTQTIGSLETNLSKVSTGQNRWLLEMFEKGDGIDGTSPITIKDIIGKPLRKAILVDDSATSNQSQFDNQYLGRATTYVYLDEDYNWETTATSDDGSTIYLNGVAIATLTSCAPTAVTVPFKQGWNKITWVYNEGIGGDGWDFNPRLTTLSQVKYMNAYPMTNVDEVGNTLDGDIKTVSSKQASLEQNLDGFKQTVSETYATNTSLTNVSNNLQNNYSTTSAMNSAIEQKANEITSAVSQTYATKESLTTVDNKFADYSTTSAMNSAIEQKANEITSSVSQTYATKTSVTDLSNNLTNNYSTTSAMNSAIDQKANEITSSVSETYATKYEFNNLNVGGRNFVINSGFKGSIPDTQNTPYWGYWGPVNVFYDQGKENYNEINTLYLQNRSNTGGGICQDISSKKIPKNTQITVSYDMGREFNVIKSYAALEFFDANYTQLSVIHLGEDVGHVVKTVTTPDIDYFIMRFLVVHMGSHSDGGAFLVMISNVKIEKGNKATDWSPAPEDIDNSITAVDNKFINYSTTQQMNSSIDQKANEITSAVSQTYATKTSVTDLSNNLTNNYSTTAAMNSVINQKSDSILSAVSSNYATKNELSTVDGKFANYSNTQQMNSAIDQKSDSILSTVSSTYTTKAEFNDLSIGGTNLYPNSNFVKDTPLYNGVSLKHAFFTNDMEGVSSLYNGRLLFIDAEGSSDSYLYVGDDIKVTPGKTYTISFDYWGAGSLTEQSSYILFKLADRGWQTHIPLHHEIQGDKVRRRHSQTFTVYGDTQYIQVRFGFHHNGYAWMCFDGIKIEEGNKATSWSPAPEDINASITAVDNKLVNYSTITQMNSAIDQKANEIISSVSQTYATKTTVTDLSNNLTNNYSTTAAMNSAIDQKSDAILSTVSNNYATKNDLSTVDGKFANYSTTSAMNSAINQKGDSILSTVSNTYTTKAEFNNLEIGGTNLVLNSSFANGSNNWNVNGDPWPDIIAIDESMSPTGKALKVTINTTAGGHGIWQHVRPRKTGNYTLSFYAKADTDNYNMVVGQEGSAIKDFVLTANWAKYTHTYNKDNLNSNAIIFYTRENASNGAFYLHSVKLEYGNKATDWTPAPEDINASITAVDNKFVNYSTTTQMNSAIDQKANEINMNVSNTYATKTSVNDLNNNLVNNYTTIQQMNSAIDIAKSNIKLDVSQNYASKHEVAHYFEGENKWKLDLYSLGSMSISAHPTKELMVQNNCQYLYSILIEHPNYQGSYGDTYVGYATTYMYFTGAHEWHGRVVTDDAGSVYLNDEFVISTESCQWTDITLNFRVGWNKVEVLYAEGGGGDGWQFDPEILSNPNGVMTKMNCYGQNSTEEYIKANYSTTQQMNSAIDMAKDSITSTVSQTYSTKTETNDRINNIKVGGTNFVRNGRFKGCTPGAVNAVPEWYASGIKVWYLLGQSGYDKYGCLYFHKEIQDGNICYLYQDILLEPIGRGVEVTLSYDIYTEGNNTTEIYIEYVDYEYTHSFEPIFFETNGNGHAEHTFTTTTNTDAKYIRVVYKYTSIDGMTGGYLAIIGNVKLEKGNKATDWSPNPNDIDASIQAVDGKFVNYSTTTQMNSAIDQKANEITNSVSQSYSTKTETNNAVNNLQGQINDTNNNISNNYASKSELQQTTSSITAKFSGSGGYNLLRNTGFKNGLNYWGIATYNNPQNGVVDIWGSGHTWGFPDPDANCCVILISNQSDIEYGISQNFTTTIGKTYTVSFYYASHRMSQANMIIRKPDGNWLTNKSFNPSEKSGGNADVNNWGILTHTFTATHTNHIINIVVNSTQDNGHMWIAKPMICEGELLCPYSPHPSEVYDGCTRIDRDGIKVYHNNIDGDNYTHMAPAGFYLKNKGEDVFKVDAAGLYLKGNVHITNGSVPSNLLNGQISDGLIGEWIKNGATNGSNAKSTLDNNAGNWNATTERVNGSSAAWDNAYNRVVDWAYGSVGGRTTINGGLLQTNTVTTQHLAIGDFNNYSQLVPGQSLSNRYGYASWGGGGDHFFWANGDRDYLPFTINETVNPFKQGDKVAFKFEAYVRTEMDVTIGVWFYSDDYANTYMTERTAGVHIYPGWNGYSAQVTIDCNEAKWARSVAIMIQKGADKYLEVRNVVIARMTGSVMIEDGAITASKISAGAVTADKISVTDLSALNASIGGFSMYSGKLVGTGGNGVGMSGNGDDWAFWAGSNTGGNAPFHVGHEGNLYATQAYITGTITSSTINGGTINGGVINGSVVNSDSFIGDLLAIDGTISAKSLQVEDIDNAKYPGAVTADFRLYISTSGNDDSELENGATFATFDGLLDKLPKNLNGHEVRIEMSTDITENVDFKGFFGGKIRLYMKGHTLYGYIVSRMGSARINICSGYIGNASDTSNGWGKIHPSKGYAVSSYTTTVASVDQGAIGLYNIDVYGADNYLSGSTTKLGVAGQDWGTAYLNGVSYYGCDIGARANAGGRIHDVLSYNVCTKYGFYATTGGYITLAKSEHSGGKSKNYHEADAGKVIVASGATFASGEASVPGGSAPVVPTTKTITIKSTYGDTYRSSVYNSWKKDGTARQGDYGYGDCNGCWFFGDAFSDLEGKTINKVTIKITRQSGGSSAPVGLVVKSHGHSGRPSGAPTYRTTAGTLSLATGATDTLPITNSTILSEISSGKVKGFGIQSTYNSANYAVCSGSVTVKITYTE